MNILLIILIIIIVAYLIFEYAKKKRISNLMQDLSDNWGKPKKDNYFNFKIISRYFDNTDSKFNAFHIISDKTKHDLDLDDLFEYIDRTSSKIGQQYLYYKIRTVGSPQELTDFGNLTNEFHRDIELRKKCQIALSQINSGKSYDLESLINDKPIDTPGYLKYLYLTSFLNMFLLIGGFFNPALFVFIIPVFIFNMVFHYKNKAVINYYLNGIVQLLKSLKVAKSLASHKVIHKYFDDFSFIKNIEKIKSKTMFVSLEKNFDNELTSIFWLLFELIKILFNVEILVFYSFINSIKTQKQSIEAMYIFIGELDSAISTASLKDDILTTCTPTFSLEKNISFKEIKHPLIENCISNDLDLNKNSMLLTGSNMSGKTTFIRTVAINSLLSQTLNLCFAKEFSAPFSKLYTSIRITDDLSQKTSYYLEEVLTAKELIDASQNDSPCLFILDEIFKGTNTIERISAGKAILSYLNKGKNIVFVSTHDIELTELLKKDDYLLYHFSETIENDKLYFDHKLKQGKLKTYNAIKILELHNYPSEIIKDALEVKEKNFS